MSEHSPLPWAAQPFSEGEDGIGIISLRNGSDNPSNGLVAVAALLPTEMDANDPSRALANAALIVHSVNLLPELVAALDKIAYAPKGGVGPDLRGCIEIARAALSKARAGASQS